VHKYLSMQQNAQNEANIATYGSNTRITRIEVMVVIQVLHI
jgi:hypothetical protein